MPITINTNISAMISQRNLAASSARSSTSLAKLSSGSRVPSAKEDAASLAVGTGLKVEVSALKAAQVNAQQASSVLQIADGAFGQISDILTRMKSLATTGQSGQLSGTELQFLNDEYGLLAGEIDRIAATTEFNGQALLGGSNSLSVDTLVNAGAGGLVDVASGFVGHSFDASIVNDNDRFAVFYDDSTGNITVNNFTTSQAQTINLGGTGDSIVQTGQVRELDFSNIGVKITINSDFNNNAGALATGAVIGSGADIGTGPGLAGGVDVNIEFAANAVSTSGAATFEFQVGSGNGVVDANNRISITVAEGNFDALVGATHTNLTSTTASATASDELDTAVTAVNTARAAIGANLNKLEFANSNLAVTIENTEAARSTLMDVDVSAEITKFSSEQVLIQAGVSMLAQANQQPSLLLRLLQ